MAFLKAFGSYLPSRIVRNEEIGAMVGSSAEWIFNVSGIEERRFAAEGETVADMAAAAAEDCLAHAGRRPNWECCWSRADLPSAGFPGPAASVANRLKLDGVPAIDLPMASAGSLFGMALAARLAPVHGNVLVVAAEKNVGRRAEAAHESGDLDPVRRRRGRVPDFVRFRMRQDRRLGALHRRLVCRRLETGARRPVGDERPHRDSASLPRKIPRAIGALLEKCGRAPGDTACFLMHQANQNLIDRVADALGVAAGKFYSNIRRYGNTSSASMLIAAAEWQKQAGFEPGVPVVFATFGAGFHWGALLAEGS